MTKTLDEVIDGLRDRIGFGDPVLVDAIHYLKEYQRYQNTPSRNGHMALVDYFEESQKNEPLTWNELRQMEGKPAWVEEENQPSQWYLIGDVVETDEDDYPEFVSMIVFDCQGDYLFYKYNMGTTWKAYRKERE